MTKIWIVADMVMTDSTREIYGAELTEHDAHALVGRIALERGSGIALDMIPCDTTGTAGAPLLPLLPDVVARPALDVPEFLQGRLGSDWNVDENDPDDEIILRSGVTYVGRIAASPLTTAEDRELAGWLAALVNRELNR